MDDIATFILAELVSQLGGEVKLDYATIKNNVINEKYKNIRIDLVDDKIVVGVNND